MTRPIVPEWAITLTQPWATLMVLGEKRIETRGWGTTRRGRVAIHAAKGFPKDARYLTTWDPFRTVLAKHGYESAAQLPTAAIVGTVDLVRCDVFKPDTLEHIRDHSAHGRLPAHEGDFGDFTAGRYGLLTRDPVRLKVVVAARGALGFWRIPSDVRELLETALERHAA